MWVSLLRTSVCLAWALLVSVGCSEDPPHLVLFTADTLRADHTSLSGYARETTPNLDALARDAVVFSQAVTLVPKTGPSFATHFTGRLPETHGVTSNRYALPEELPLLAERLAEAGYASAAFVSNPILAPRKGFSRGFDRYEEFGKREGLEPQWRAFSRWAEAHDWSQPTFVWFHSIDPHGPYTPPPSVRDRFVGDPLFTAESRTVPLEYELQEGVPPSRVVGALPRYQRIGDEDRVAWYVSQYDAEIYAMDAVLGRLVTFLRDRSLYDQAALVFTSDHGESLGEHDYYFEHGWFVYDATLRVPLVLKPPAADRVPPGVRTEQVSNVDTVPTLLALAGLRAPPGLPGKDLLAAAGDERPVLAANPSTYPERFVALRTPEFKYVRELEGGAESAYALVDDPDEEIDISARAPAVMTQLRAQWEALRAAQPTPQGRSLPRAPTDEERRRLEELGYLEP